LIAYVDSSALARIVLRQPGFEQLQAKLIHVNQQYCHQIGYVELRSAAARLVKRDRLDATQQASLLHSTAEIWAATTVQSIDDLQIQRAAELCERYQLRACDALHLVAAEALMHIVSSKYMRWFGFDEMQNRAAVAIGLKDGMVA
jgi:uncharacterized protein